MSQCTKAGILLGRVVLFLLLISSQFANAQMKVVGKTLRDVNGERVIARGVEQSMGNNHELLDEMAKTGANAVRLLPNLEDGPNQMSTAEVDNLIQKARSLGMFVYLSPYPQIPAGSNKNVECWNWYERDDVFNMLQKHKDYLIIDAVQEHTDPTPDQWAATCKTGIDRLRRKGYKNPLLMMSNEYGRNANTIILKAAEVFNYDPEKNTFFNVQAYWGACPYDWCTNSWGKGTSTQIVTDNITRLAALDQCVQIGITPWSDGSGCDEGYVDYVTAMAECQKNGLGWLVWDWYNPWEWSHVYSVTTNGVYGGWNNHCTNTLTSDCRDNGPFGCDYGYQVTVGHAASIQKTAVKSCYFRGNVNCAGSGGSVVREVWSNVGGTTVAAIPVNTPPTSTSNLTSLEAPTNVADDYGVRIRGYITPATTGNYKFYIAADDNAEFWLNSSGTLTRRAFIEAPTGWTSPKQWDKNTATQQSADISLTAGSRYYFEILHKEGGGGDNLAVGWTGPGISAITVVPGSVLSPFTPETTFSGTYKITARHSSKALNVTGSSTADGANVQQLTDNGTAAQQWIITVTTDGFYKLVNKGSNKALEVGGFSLADGGNVQQWSFTGVGSQQWKIEATTDGFHKLTNRNSGKVLDVSGNSTADGANVHQWGYVGGNNQQWKLERLSTATARTDAQTGPEAATGQDFTLYPNPVTAGKLTLELVSPEAGKATVRITGSLGQNTVGQEVSVEKGRNVIHLSTGGLARGLYLVTLEQGLRRTVRKVYVQ